MEVEIGGYWRLVCLSMVGGGIKRYNVEVDGGCVGIMVWDVLVIGVSV